MALNHSVKEIPHADIVQVWSRIWRTQEKRKEYYRWKNYKQNIIAGFGQAIVLEIRKACLGRSLKIFICQAKEPWLSLLSKRHGDH